LLFKFIVKHKLKNIFVVVSDASDFVWKLSGKNPTRRISSGSFREGIRRVGFRLEAFGKESATADFVLKPSGRNRNVATASGSFREGIATLRQRPEAFGKESQRCDGVPKAAGNRYRQRRLDFPVSSSENC
jgi:hypothetical protein